jgi:hypothetical protein
VVKSVFRENLDERALAAEAEATDVVDADFVFESAFFDLLFEFFEDGVAVVSETACATAHHDGALATKAFDFLIEGFAAIIDVLL